MARGREREVEVALVVCAPEPGSVADEVAELADIAGYALEPGPDQQIHDQYFDFDDGRLGDRGLAFRVRNIDGRDVLTVKGPGRRMTTGAKDRLEVEGDWSLSVLGHALHLLAGFGVDVPVDVAPAGPPQPRPALERLGFLIVQDRHTLRRPRRVTRVGGSGDVLAELAIDAVEYELPRRNARLFEVEVETTRLAGSLVLAELASALLTRWPDQLRRWPHSKLATGFALDALAAPSSLGTLTDRDGVLKPAAWERLEERLGPF
ncbi:MAG: CYTH domain-containing protein [Gemmatimonadota bacterium]